MSGDHHSAQFSGRSRTAGRSAGRRAALPDTKQDWDRSGLPGWAYFSEELLELERDLIFRRHWQLVCHVNDLPDPGDFLTFEIADERALIVRGADGRLRAFHNLCRHRGSRVAAPTRGRGAKRFTCPFHGWVYGLDGRLRGIPQRGSFPQLKNTRLGLKPVEMEIWRGFVFLRFQPGPQGSVAAVLQRIDSEAQLYGLENLLPASERMMSEAIDANWKSVRDVDNEGYHVAQAHPGLHELYGRGYFDEPYVGGVARSVGPFNDGPGSRWSVRNYKTILPEARWLPGSHRQLWLYIGVFPNFVFGFYPDSVIFYQEIPVSASKTIQRSAVYRRPDEFRELRLARYLSGRIDRDTAEEDRQLTLWSCEGTRSSAFDGILLSDLESGLGSFHDHLRAYVPALELSRPPPPGRMAEINESLLNRTAD